MTTTISVSRQNRERLASFGKAGEPLDAALDRVLKFAEAKDILGLNELSDVCLMGNFGFSEERIRKISFVIPILSAKTLAT